MRVLFVATEVAPWVKVGGLGDVVGSLPSALRSEGVDARVCVPAHAGILRVAPNPRRVASYAIGHANGPVHATVWETELEGVPAYLIAGPPIPEEGVVYTGRMDEEGERFVFFSLAALELCRHLEWVPDVLHCHDWHSAVVPHALAQQRTGDAALEPIASLLSVHNLPYSGQGADAALRAYGIAGTDDPRVSYGHRTIPLVLGLASADALSTVSEGYAREILGPEHGCGFEHLLRERRADLTGIRNGLDVVSWDPMGDAALAAPYGPDAMDGRARCRAALHAELALPDDDAPLVAVVSRLVAQKGLDLIAPALRQLRELPWKAVVLGTGDPWIERALETLAAEMPDRVRVKIGFDETLARRIYAGADCVAMPSRYEPCGMTQLIAMRYGCVPVARETGGLADTVADVDLSDDATGVLFADATPSSLAFALRRAFSVSRTPRWAGLIDHGMRTDWSWQASARVYVRLYERLARSRARKKA